MCMHNALRTAAAVRSLALGATLLLLLVHVAVSHVVRCVVVVNQQLAWLSTIYLYTIQHPTQTTTGEG
jgi:hypothetical protein